MTMNSDTVSVLEGNTFGRRNGDVDAGRESRTASSMAIRVVCLTGC